MATRIVNANQYGLLSEERLQAFEETLGITLPPDYREFLKRRNGGKPEPGGFWIVEGKDGSEVRQFYGLHDGPKWLSIDCYLGAGRHGIPTDLLPIGDDGVGNTICIGVYGDRRGSVYFVDHEMHPYDEPDSFEGVTKLADSFSEFLSRLHKLSG